MNDSVNNRRNAKDITAVVLTWTVMVLTLFFSFASLNEWAVASFARPILASALLAAIDTGLFILALALAPLLSRVIRMFF